MITMAQRSGDAAARRLDCVFADRLGIARRQFAVPVDNRPRVVARHLRPV
jgi:hypothetical protein